MDRRVGLGFFNDRLSMHRELLGDDVDVRLHALEREQKINTLLDEIKARKRLSA